MKQVYGTDEVYSVIGDDVYLAFKERGKFKVDNGVKYIVTLRGPDSPLATGDPERPANVTFFNPRSADSLSSTKVRQKVRDRQPIPSEWVHPLVRRVIDDEGLYHGPKAP